MARSQNKFTEMFLGLLSAETANIIPPEMTARTENRKKKSFKRHLGLDQWPHFKTISQKNFLSQPLPKLLKWSRSAEQNCHQS